MPEIAPRRPHRKLFDEPEFVVLPYMQERVAEAKERWRLDKLTQVARLITNLAQERATQQQVADMINEGGPVVDQQQGDNNE